MQLRTAKRASFIAAVLCVSAWAADSSTPTPTKSPAVAPDYRIGSGDVLQIVVWKEPDASVPSAVVRPDGKITVPLIKQIDVLGRTPTEVERAIADRISGFIDGTDVTVVVAQVNSKKAYLVGAVKKEGPISLPYRMTMLQALSEAGGLTDYAKKSKIYILRARGGAAPTRIPFNYEEVIEGKRMEQNIWVEPEDTIVVPQ
jgi:polysaccharide export outer membrane protein